jgi:hypothetical protein
MSKLNLTNLKRLCAEATGGNWDAFFVFGSRDLPSSIEVETGKINIIAGVECPERIKICDVAEDSDRPTHNFRYIAAANPATLSQLIECVEIMKVALETMKKAGSHYNYNEERGVLTQAWLNSPVIEEALSEVAKRVEGV